MVPDRNGNYANVIQAHDSIENHLNNNPEPFLSTLVGRYGNRIGGAKFTLNGTEYTLFKNDGNNSLHGGLEGFDKKWFKGTTMEAEHEDCVVLTYVAHDGEEGYPGTLKIQVTYRLTEDALELEYEAVSDKDTLCNLTNHSYFNLAGHNSGSVLNQDIQIFAQHYTPSNNESIPFGVIAPIADTPMDFQTPTPIGAHINEAFHQLLYARGYDHNYVLSGGAGKLHPVAQAYASATGITMQAETTLPGVHFYTANYLPHGRTGKGGCTYAPRHGFCLETQLFPDAPNQPNFPTAVLQAGEEYEHTTKFSFSTV